MTTFLFSFLFSILIQTTNAAPAPTAVLGEVVSDGKRLRADRRGVVILAEEDLAREAGRTVGELLRESAGVDFISGTGGNSNLLIRGSSGSQVLVLIDGVKANDPSASNRYFDWSRIDVSQVERVEVLKGPQAVSYGSDAIGGVVLIRTKRGQGGFTASVEGGSEAFLRTRASYAMNLDRIHALKFSALGKGVFAGGSSALGTTPSASLEGDNSQEASIGAELDSRFSESFRSKFSADLRAAKEDIDGGSLDDDPNSVARNREIRTALNLEGAQWKSVVSYLNFRRAYSDYPDATHNFGSDSVYHGENSRAEIQMHSETSSRVEYVGGLELTRETLGIDSIATPTILAKDHAESVAAFLEAAIPLDSERIYSIDLGSRSSYFSTYKYQWSGKLGATARPSERLTFDAGISTGFKAPSLYSLYEPTYGNADLKPEESVQAELGATLALTRDMTFSLRGFESRVRNRFGFAPSPSFRSLNIDRAELRGVEAEFDRRWSGLVRSSMELTYLSTHDRKTGGPLNDVSKWKHTTKLILTPRDATSITLSLLAKSGRNSSTGLGRVSGFGRLDLAWSETLTPNLSATARVENLLDRDYQEIRGFRSLGLSAYAGLEYRGL